MKYSELKQATEDFNAKHGIKRKVDEKMTADGKLVEMTGKVVLKNSSLSREFPVEQRAYEFSNCNKALTSGDIGYSIFADCKADNDCMRIDYCGNDPISPSDPLIETVHYRGMSIPVWRSVEGGFYYTVLAGQTRRIEGDYRRSLLGSIDAFVDTVWEWPDRDAKLIGFQNGGAYDLKLVKGGRTLWIALSDGSGWDGGRIEAAAAIAEGKLCAYEARLKG